MAHFSTVVAEMEFRIFHDIFCETYRIQKVAFAFDEYVRLVYEKFVVGIIKLHLMNWVLFIVSLLIALAGKKMEESFGDCPTDHGHHDYACMEIRSTKIYIIFGKLAIQMIICEERK